MSTALTAATIAGPFVALVGLVLDHHDRRRRARP